MEKRIFLLAIGLAMLLSLSTQAQDSNGLMVKTSPAGAAVTLEGDAYVTGVSPALFRQELVGYYKVTINRHGYERYTTAVTLDPNRQFNLDISLTKKTRVKAAARSLFIPGWGQKYSDQKSKSFFFQLAAAGAGVAYLLADNSFDNKYDDYLALRSAYGSATEYTERQRLYEQLSLAQNEAYDAENKRRVIIGIGVGVWALNVLDALLFFPDVQDSFTVKGLTLTPEATQGRLGFAISGKF